MLAMSALSPHSWTSWSSWCFCSAVGLSGNSKDYHSPLNSCINTVVSSRKGNPLSLCVLYSIIARSLDMPVYGVNLPNHFVLTYLDEDRMIEIAEAPGGKNGVGAVGPGGVCHEK